MLHPKFLRLPLVLLSGLLMPTSLWSAPGFGASAIPPATRSEVANPTRFARLTVPGPFTCSESVSRCGWRVLRALEVSRPSRRANSREEIFTFGNGVVIFLYTQANLEDDAIAAERYRVAFQQVGSTLRLVQAGRQQQCLRDRAGWTKRLCP